MTRNVGGTERPIRILLGIGLLGLGAFAGLPVVYMAAALVFGTIALVTGCDRVLSAVDTLRHQHLSRRDVAKTIDWWQEHDHL